MNLQIPQYIIDRWSPDKKKIWYSKKLTYFKLGYELEFLGFIKYSLYRLSKERKLKNDEFSYNFIPGYIRVVTHYGVMDLVFQYLDRAIVIIFNGIGNKYYYKSGDDILEFDLEKLNEPSEQVYKIIEKYPNRPIFVTVILM